MNHIIRATTFDKKGKRLSSAVNRYDKSHPLQAHFAKMVGQPARQFLHAEIAALLKSRDKRVHSIYVERYGRDGKPRNAAPCPICRAALGAFGVKKITYTVD